MPALRIAAVPNEVEDFLAIELPNMRRGEETGVDGNLVSMLAGDDTRNLHLSDAGARAVRIAIVRQGHFDPHARVTEVNFREYAIHRSGKAELFHAVSLSGWGGGGYPRTGRYRTAAEQQRDDNRERSNQACGHGSIFSVNLFPGSHAGTT